MWNAADRRQNGAGKSVQRVLEVRDDPVRDISNDYL